MTGVTLEAIGVPAAALCCGPGGVARRRSTLTVPCLRLLGSDGASLVGEPAEALLPRAVLAAWLDASRPNPIDTRLGPIGLPYRA